MNPNALMAEEDHEFPSSDGKPMAENTRQYEAVVTLKGNIEAFAPTNAFVAGDHLIYVDRTDATACQAPDVYVAFGRPRGHRPCYKVWEEGGVFPQVVFEVLAPSNDGNEMSRKRAFYFEHGAEEYYEFDPEAGEWAGWVRDRVTGVPVAVPEMGGYTSPRLGMRFEFRPLELRAFRPDGTRFLSFQELEDDRRAQRHRADNAERRIEEEGRRAEEQRRELERQRLAERLRADEESRRADEERNAAEQARREAAEQRRRADEERNAAEQARREAAEQRRRADEAQQRAEARGQMAATRSSILRHGAKRFGAPSEACRAALDAIADRDRLVRLDERLLDAADWDDLLATP
jgi:Uma2 family endonuclease